MKPRRWPGKHPTRIWFFPYSRGKKRRRSRIGMRISVPSVGQVLHCGSPPEPRARFIHSNSKLQTIMQSKFFFRFAPVILAAGALSMLSTGCSRSNAQQRPPAPPSVTVATVEQKEIAEWDEFTGRTEPVEAVDVRPRVS